MEFNDNIFSNWQLFLSQLLSLISFLILLVIAIRVFIKSRSRTAHLYFGFLSLAMSVWSLTNFISDLTKDVEFSLLWAQLTFLGPAFAPTLFLLFSYHFLRQKPHLSWWVTTLLFVPSLAVIWLIPTRYNIDSVEWNEGYGVVMSKAGELYSGYIAYLVPFAIIGLSTLYKKYRSPSTSVIGKMQIRYIFSGTAIATFIALVANLILPSFGNNRWYWLGVVGIAAFTALVSYAILRYRFMDARVAIRKGFVYAITLIVLLLIYGFFVLLANDFLVDQYRLSSVFVVFLSVFVIAITFMPLRKMVIQITNKVFFASAVSQPSLSKNIRNKVTRTIEVEQFQKVFDEELRKEIDVETITLIVHQRRDGVFSSIRGKDTIQTDSEFVAYLKKLKDLVIRDELPYMIDEADGEKKELLEVIDREIEKLGCAVAIPLATKEDLWGIALLSEKQSGAPFSVSDVAFLRGLASEAAYALENVIMYKEALERIGVK